MSFVKDSLYKAIADAGGVLTVGNVYRCLRSDTHCSVIDDRGRCTQFTPDCFDPAPCGQAPAAPTKQHTIPLAFGARAASGPPTCCGVTPKLHQFTTFSFFACPVCKKEVGGKAEAAAPKPERPALTTNQVSSALNAIYGHASVGGGGSGGTHSVHGVFPQAYGNVAPSNSMQQKALPPGVYALKGEQTVCVQCNSTTDAVLSCDLTDQTRGSCLSHGQGLSCVCGANDPIEYQIGRTRYNVWGRGLV